jgi:hypothetical protein
MDLLPDSEMILEEDPYIRSERTYWVLPAFLALSTAA